MPDPAPGSRSACARLAYEGATLFENLRFRLEAGSWTCLLGPSGVGKTSLLRLIAGLRPGRAGRRRRRSRARAARVALMAQQDLLLPWLPVVDNVILGFRLRGPGRPSAAACATQATALLARVGLERQAQVACPPPSPAACASAWRSPAR